MSPKCVLFLCGFLATLSLVISLHCNVKFHFGTYQFPDKTLTCPSGGNVNYECVTLRYNTAGTPVLLMNCSRRCDNEAQICSYVEERLRDVTNCSAACCDTDLCNTLASDMGSTKTTIVEKKRVSKEMKKNKSVLDKMENSHQK